MAVHKIETKGPSKGGKKLNVIGGFKAMDTKKGAMKPAKRKRG